jgi:hypothetical protein
MGCGVQLFVKGLVMDRTLDELEMIVRKRICGVCTDRNDDKTCGLEEPGKCSLFRMFPLVARAIQGTDSNDIQDYIHAIRQQVCSVCALGDPDGGCEERRRVQCALDAYLVLVVEAIEEATGVSCNASKPARGPFPTAAAWVRKDWTFS